MRNLINGLRNHVIVCGYGRLGRIVVDELLNVGEAVVVIENNPEAVQELSAAGIPHLNGNSYSDETLIEAGIAVAKSLVSLLSNDADNVYTVLCARDLNAKISILGRSESDAGDKRLRRAGANIVVAPYRLSGTRLVQRLIRPHVSDFLEIASGSENEQLVLEEVVVPHDSPLGGRTLAESGLRAKTGAIIAAVINSQGEMEFNPEKESIIEPGSTLIILGKRNSLDILNKVLYQQ